MAIGRLLVLLIPLVGVVGVIYPLFRFMPTLYGLEVQWRISRMYRELRQLEEDPDSRGAGRTLDDLTERLNRLEEKASHLEVPLFYANLLYTLRMHIALVRERLTRTERKPTAE